MTVIYRGASSPIYAEQDYRRLNNGAQASSHLFRGIFRNQTWLGYSDPGAVNFFTGPARRFSDTDVVVELLPVDIPPGVVEIEFRALLCRSLDPADVGSTQPSFIVESDATSASARIRGVEVTGDGKRIPGIAEASWYTLPRLRVAAEPKPFWRRDLVTVSVETDTVGTEGIWVFSMYYRHIPIEGSIPFNP